MIPVTTPTFILTLKNADGILKQTINLRVDIRQQNIIISKNMEDLIIDYESNSIGIFLTQKETAKFLYRRGSLEFQVHGLLFDGLTAWKTYIVDVPIEKSLTKEVLKNYVEKRQCCCCEI